MSNKMRTKSILATILCAAVLLTGCNKEESMGGPEAAGGPSVRLTLGGSAAPGTKTVTRSSGDDSNPGTTAAEEAEKSVADLRAVLFSTTKGFYKTVEATSDDNGGYTFLVEQDDTYDVWLVANADETLRTALESIPAGTKPDDETKGLGAVIATQASDADNAFLMLSVDKFTVTTEIAKTQDAGDIHMRRLSVRIDIINAADGIEVTKVKFNNRAKQSYLQTPNTMPTGAEWFETKEYTPTGLVGDKTTPTKYEHEIYTYENCTAKGGTALPTLTLEYTEGGQTKTHTVEFIDANAADHTPLALKRNYLYRITLNKVYQLGFQMEVLDWDEAETFEVPDLPLDVESQEELNAKLKVNMFTEYNVKSADLATKTVNSFYDQLTVSFADCPTDSYFTYTELQNAGLTTADAVLTDGQGNKYRLPTEGELSLLLPMWTELAERDDLGNKHWGVCHPWWNDNLSTNNPGNAAVDSYVMSSKVSKEGWKETIYLKNGADNYPDKTTNAGETDGDYVVSGKSWMTKGTQIETVHYYTAEPDDPEKGNYNIAPVYSIRFKGTSQYAAYRWESCQIAGNPLERYFSIKIKALPEDSEMTVDDLIGNNSFWAEGCIEFKFPASGYYPLGTTPDGTNDNISNRGINGYCWSSSLWNGDSYACCLNFSLSNTYVGHGVLGVRFPLRLVKAE